MNSRGLSLGKGSVGCFTVQLCAVSWQHSWCESRQYHPVVLTVSTHVDIPQLYPSLNSDDFNLLIHRTPATGSNMLDVSEVPVAECRPDCGDDCLSFFSRNDHTFRLCHKISLPGVKLEVSSLMRGAVLFFSAAEENIQNEDQCALTETLLVHVFIIEMLFWLLFLSFFLKCVVHVVHFHCWYWGIAL